MKKQRREIGVTLIALVITIIILIILAGVAINTLIGDNGIITQAQRAKENTELAKIEEEKGLNHLYDELMSEGNITILDKTIEQMKTEGTYVTGNAQLRDSKGNKVVVPDGFKIAGDSGNNVSEGIVIEDNDKTTDGNGNLRGNQFVWIPVSNINADGSNQIVKADGTKVEITLGRYTFANDGIETLVQKGENYAQETVIETYYKELSMARIGNGSTGIDGTNTTARDLNKFIKSVKNNGGYYIARYEASYKDGVKPYSKISLTGSTVTTQIDGKVWNAINQLDAAKAAKAMYNNRNFATDLVNSYAWDTAISYIQKCSNDKDYSRQISLNASMASTGKNGDEVCKINDMASNMREWTTEYSSYIGESSAGSATNRGGNAYDTSTYTCYRNYTNANSYYDYVSFRPILYM